MILGVEVAIKTVGCHSAYEQAAVAKLCREVCGVPDGALWRVLRAQGSLEVCSQVLGSSLVPSPFPLHSGTWPQGTHTISQLIKIVISVSFSFLRCSC